MPKIEKDFMNVSRNPYRDHVLDIVEGRGVYPLPLFAVDVNGVFCLTLFTTDDEGVFFDNRIRDIAHLHAKKMKAQFHAENGRGMGAVYRLTYLTEVLEAYSDGDYSPTAHPFSVIAGWQEEEIKTAVLRYLYH
jgi:hypothetical protein